MSVQKIQYINIKDITDFLFSPSSLKSRFFSSKNKKDLPGDNPESSTAKIKNALGLVLSKRGTIAPDPFAAASTYAKKNGLGFVAVDQDMIVRHINETAAQFLSLQQKEFVGHVFDFFIMPNEKQNISIIQQNGRPGIGRMSVRDNGNTDVPYYLILIEDIASGKKISL